MYPVDFISPFSAKDEQLKARDDSLQWMTALDEFIRTAPDLGARSLASASAILLTPLFFMNIKPIFVLLLLLI